MIKIKVGGKVYESGGLNNTGSMSAIFTIDEEATAIQAMEIIFKALLVEGYAVKSVQEAAREVAEYIDEI